MQTTSDADPRANLPRPERSRWRAWLGLEPNILVLLAAILILGMGEELWTRFVPKYLQLLGASIGVISLYGSLKDLLDAVYPYPGGWLADRLGRRNALVIFILLAMLGYGLYLAAPSWEWILLGTFFVMAWESLTLPAIFAIIGDNLPQARRALGFGVQSILKRVPRMIAPIAGGALVASLGLLAGMKLSLAITLALGLLGIVIVRRYYVERKPPAGEPAHLVSVWRGMDPRLKRLLVADCLARWAEGIPKVFIILYVIDQLGATALEFGWLISVQMLTATLLYLPIAKLSDWMNRRFFVSATFACFALFPLVLVSAVNFFGLVLAFVVAGLREIGEPARKALIVDLVQASVRGRAVGLYYLIRGLVVFPASLLGGWLWSLNPEWPFYAAFLAGVAGFLAYAVAGPDKFDSPTMS